MDMSEKGNQKDPKHEPAAPAENIKAVDYLRAIKASLKAGKQKDAFALLQQASLHFPDSPLILSYYGCLQAVVDKKYRSGVETCNRALSLLQEQASFEEDTLYPVLYLNLGRALVAAKKKQDAVDAFKTGLTYDRSHYELLKEVKALGQRKQPPVPFLDRANPINKYIGMILHKGKKAPVKGRTKS
jgi:tetratricopeptide (TPR) repeat protein